MIKNSKGYFIKLVHEKAPAGKVDFLSAIREKWKKFDKKSFQLIQSIFQITEVIIKARGGF